MYNIFRPIFTKISSLNGGVPRINIEGYEGKDTRSKNKTIYNNRKLRSKLFSFTSFVCTKISSISSKYVNVIYTVHNIFVSVILEIRNLQLINVKMFCFYIDTNNTIIP